MLKRAISLARLWNLKRSVLCVHSGISIVDMNWGSVKRPERKEVFVLTTKRALELLERSDERRFQRVQREIKYIVNEVVASSGGEYGFDIKRCSIDFDRYNVQLHSGHYEWHVAQYASFIVHEATHGHLFSRGIPYSKKTRGRVERLCCIEQRRFAQKLHSDTYNFSADLVPDCDEVSATSEGSPFFTFARYVHQCIRNFR